MQNNLDFIPEIGTNDTPAVVVAEQIQKNFRSLATLQSGTSRPQGIKSSEFWCKDLEGNGTKFQVFRYIEVTTPEGVQKIDIPWTIELVQSISDSTTASTEKAPSEKAVALALEQAILTARPTGSLLISMADSVPGHLIGTGAAVSRETYKDLFAIIGTTFGAGDGSTTFNLPDFRGRFIQGASGDDIGAYRNSGLPNVYGAFVNSGNTYNDLWDSDVVEGAAFVELDSTGRQSNSNSTIVLSTKKKAGIDASRFNPIYGSSEIVQPPAIALNVFIKY